MALFFLQMLSLCDHHLSLYQLTLERGTQLFKDVAAGLIVRLCFRVPEPF